MIVKPIEGEPTRYRVQSETDPTEWYLVDICSIREDYGCSCKNFMYDMQKYVDNGEALFQPELTSCKHLECVIRYIALQWIEQNTTA